MLKELFTRYISQRGYDVHKPLKPYYVEMGFFYPYGIRLEASSICQLKCPSCPTAKGTTSKSSGGRGFLKFDDFKKIIDENSWIKKIELSNWGEIFLNPDLLKIMKYAYETGISLTARNGVNFNTVNKEVLEALVQYEFKYLSISIDGASPETYSMYRKRGDFNQVIENVFQLNEYKKKYNSEYPRLRWQFVLFEHNKHELETANSIANKLKMEFSIKLSWDKKLAVKVDGRGAIFSNGKIESTEKLDEGGFDASRSISNPSNYQLHGTTQKLISIIQELEHKRNQFLKTICMQLWLQPQINWDGKILGCCVNYWGDYGNVFDFPDLLTAFSNEKIVYARRMSSGQVQKKKGIPCTTCHQYKKMRREKDWITLSELINPRKDLTENYA